MDFLKGAGVGLFTSNPLSQIVNTGADVVDLAGMGASMFGKALGLMDSSQMYEPLDRSKVPLSSEWARDKVGLGESTSGMLGELAGGFVNPGKAIKTGLFGGKNARGGWSPRPDVVKAMNEYRATGKLPDKIPKGLLVGPDGKLRFEISDDMATLIGNNYLTPGKYQAKDVLHHPDFYNAYLGAKQIPVHVIDDPASNFRGRVSQDANGQPTVTLNKAFLEDAKQARSTMLHELQHWIQVYREGFATGTNTDHAKSVLEEISTRINAIRDPGEKAAAIERANKAISPISSNTKGFDMSQWQRYTPEQKRAAATAMYYGKAGEWESRLVESRKDMDIMERWYNPPDFNTPQALNTRATVAPVLWEDVVRNIFPDDVGPGFMYSHANERWPLRDSYPEIVSRP
jgi:hypothetical protein